MNTFQKIMMDTGVRPIGLDAYFSRSEYMQWFPDDFDESQISGCYRNYVLYCTPERRAFVSGVYLLSAEEIMAQLTALSTVEAELLRYNLLPFACSMSGEYIYINYLNSEIFWAKTNLLDVEDRTITISDDNLTDVVLPLNKETLNYCLVCIGVFTEVYFEKLFRNKFFMVHVVLENASFNQEDVKIYLENSERQK